MRAVPRVSTSILGADFGHLADEVQSVEAAGADMIHVDAMDGRFVSNLSVGPVVVSAVRQATRLPIETHLMVYEPERFLESFAQAGADTIFIHLEATAHPQQVLHAIRKLGRRAGVVLCPHTPEGSVSYVMEDVDAILVMTVNPGFGGQRFLDEVVPKIAAIRQRIDAMALPISLQVDGGVTPETARIAVAQGADVLIAGTAVFGQSDRRLAIEALRGSTAK